jgi:hypothetical protein
MLAHRVQVGVMEEPVFLLGAAMPRPFLEHFDRPVDFAQLGIGAGGVVAGVIIIRIDELDPLQPFQRLFFLTERCQRRRAELGRAGIFRMDLQLFLSALEAHATIALGLFEPTQRPVDNLQQQWGLGIVRLNLQGPGVELDGLFRLALGDAEASKGEVGVIIVAVKLQRPLECRRRFRPAAAVGQRLAASGMGFGQVGVERQGR